MQMGPGSEVRRAKCGRECGVQPYQRSITVEEKQRQELNKQERALRVATYDSPISIRTAMPQASKCEILFIVFFF